MQQVKRSPSSKHAGRQAAGVGGQKTDVLPSKDALSCNQNGFYSCSFTEDNNLTRQCMNSKFANDCHTPQLWSSGTTAHVWCQPAGRCGISITLCTVSVSASTAARHSPPRFISASATREHGPLRKPCLWNCMPCTIKASCSQMRARSRHWWVRLGRSRHCRCPVSLHW